MYTLPDEERVRFSSLRLVLEPKVLSNLMPFFRAEMGVGMAGPCQKILLNTGGNSFP
jgi:hypothetical protein